MCRTSAGAANNYPAIRRPSEGSCIVVSGLCVIEQPVPLDLRQKTVGGAHQRPFSLIACLHAELGIGLVRLVSGYNTLFGDSHLNEPRGHRGSSSGDETTRVEEEEYRRITRIIGSLVDIELKGDAVASVHLCGLGERRHCCQVGRRRVLKNRRQRKAKKG